MNNLNTDSLITKDASTAIKGLLMLLIVFGHTGMLTTNFSTDEKTFLYDWLYTFHVHIFLIMPFIYGYKQKTSKGYAILNDLKHNLVKIGAPYFWFFLLYTLVFITVGGGKLNLSGIIYAFFFGSQTLMSKYIGFNMMWFLPAMLALVTLKSVWYNSQTVVRNCLLTISIILWLFCIFRIVEMGEVGLYIPFAISQGFYYLLLGLVSRWLIENFTVKKMMPWALCGIFISYDNAYFVFFTPFRYQQCVV